METFLRLRAIDKHFPGVHALKEVNFELNKGECVALRRKWSWEEHTDQSTGGAHRPDSGEIWLGGKEMFLRSPRIRWLQESQLFTRNLIWCPDSAWWKIFLGIEPHDYGWVRREDENRRAKEVLQRIGATIGIGKRCDELTVAEKQMVEIAKALIRNAQILVMDEPSAASPTKRWLSSMNWWKTLRYRE